MEKCIIVTAYIEGRIKDIVDVSDAFIICADGGYDLAKSEGIKPDVVIGDFDSATALPNDINFVRYPIEKDFTDTALCIKYAAEHGYNSIMIVGGFGGRLDHTIANIQDLFGAAECGLSVMMADAKNIAIPLIDDEICIPKQENQYFSVFSFSDHCKGITIEGAKYNLKAGELVSTFPLGVSNYVVDEFARISVESGRIILIISEYRA